MAPHQYRGRGVGSTICMAAVGKHDSMGLPHAKLTHAAVCICAAQADGELEAQLLPALLRGGQAQRACLASRLESLRTLRGAWEAGDARGVRAATLCPPPLYPPSKQDSTSQPSAFTPRARRGGARPPGTEQNRTELSAEAAPHNTAPHARGRTELHLGVG